MTPYVALVTDGTGRYANVLVYAGTWHEAVDQLEDLGCEVVEDQSVDYEDCLPDEFTHLGVYTTEQLISNTDFVPHD